MRCRVTRRAAPASTTPSRRHSRRFCKNGSDATTAAVRFARAVTGRKKVAFCSDHPFFSVDDWFIERTPFNCGIPEEMYESSIGFRYNDLDHLASRFRHDPDAIACVILEPAKNDEPEPGFLEDVRDLCHAHGALLIFDEMITGF